VVVLKIYLKTKLKI